MRLAGFIYRILCLLCMFSLFETAWGQDTFRLTSLAKFRFGMDSGYIWHTGDMLIPAGGRIGSGTKVDVNTDLGVDQSEATAVTLNAAIQDLHYINFEYLMYSPSGTRRLTRPFLFHNRTYSPETLLETKLDFNWLRLEYGYKLWDETSWWIAPRIGVHHIRYTASLNGTTEEEGLTSNTRSLDGTYPVVGLEARYLFPLGAELVGELEGIHLITRGFLTFGRVEVRLDVHPDVTLSLAGFSRIVQYQEDFQPLNNEWYFSLFGWTAGVSFAF